MYPPRRPQAAWLCADLGLQGGFPLISYQAALTSPSLTTATILRLEGEELFLGTTLVWNGVHG
jgi:hypothetical protein